jgi:prolyl 4-hydroxylase
MCHTSPFTPSSIARRFQDPIIERIEQRIASWTHIPIEHQEDIQVLRYEHGQSYRAHYDSSYDKAPDGLGPKFRLATLLMYLSDVEEGGETAFHSSRYVDSSIPEKGGPWSECAKGHVAAKPKAGDAVLFYSYFPVSPAGTLLDGYWCHV